MPLLLCDGLLDFESFDIRFFFNTISSHYTRENLDSFSFEHKKVLENQLVKTAGRFSTRISPYTKEGLLFVGRLRAREGLTLCDTKWGFSLQRARKRKHCH